MVLLVRIVKAEEFPRITHPNLWLTNR